MASSLFQLHALDMVQDYTATVSSVDAHRDRHESGIAIALGYTFPYMA